VAHPCQNCSCTRVQAVVSHCTLSESMDKVHVVCRGWMMPVLFMPTEDIFHAAGFDAVVMLKTIEFGVQLFTPMALIGLAICAARCPFPLWPC
jgi:Late exocytosis, associated with Golgi transport